MLAKQIAGKTVIRTNPKTRRLIPGYNKNLDIFKRHVNLNSKYTTFQINVHIITLTRDGADERVCGPNSLDTLTFHSFFS